MLSLVVIFASCLAGFAAAQNSTSNLDPNSVPLTTRNQWCLGEKANCPKLCGGTSIANTCEGQTLSYTCTCSNGTEPASIVQYLDTLPNHICNELFAQCNIQNPGSDQCQTCGTLKADDVPESTSSSAAPSSTATDSAAPTDAGATATSEGGAPRITGMVGLGAAGLIGALIL